MAGRTKWIAVTVVGTIVALLFGANGPLGGFWGESVLSDPEPEGAALAGLIGAGLVESVAFGVGLAWIAFGWPMMQRVGGALATWTFVAVAWGLVSWAPHTSLHVTNGSTDWGRLAVIEWGFHVTLVIGAMIVATFVWQTLQRAGERPAVATV
ncbi:MAG: hypothetical protein AAF467_01785 [Actinomycetota bacterium]